MTERMIPLTQGKFAIIDEADYETVSQFKWCALKVSNKFYAQRNVPKLRGKLQAMHTLLMETPKGLVVDHINGNGLDNRRANLRICTQGQNARNAQKTKRQCASKYKGVYWCKTGKIWRAHILVNYVMKHLGPHKNEIDAARAYDKAAREYFGAFAWLNFPNGDRTEENL